MKDIAFLSVPILMHERRHDERSRYNRSSSACSECPTRDEPRKQAVAIAARESPVTKGRAFLFLVPLHML
jgi:hypothetical protein